MANKQALERWPSHEVIITKEEDELSTFPSFQPTPLHLSIDGQSGIPPLSWEFCLPLQEISPVIDDRLMDMSIYEQPFSLLDIVPSNNFPQGDYSYGFGGGLSFHNEISAGIVGFGNESLPWPSNLNHHQQFSNGNVEKAEIGQNMNGMVNKPQREERNNSSSKMLSREIISQYFYMPITQAAKQLNIGLTLLKKRCRELGIRRWPHRKLASLETLIKNVHELSKDKREGADRRLREAIAILEREKKLMEEVPDMQLMENTKRLRQACFKANYKKRKITSMKNSSQYSTITQASQVDVGDSGVVDSTGDEEEDMQSFLYDCFSSSNGLFEFEKDSSVML